jgi:hypothetical protein
MQPICNSNLSSLILYHHAFDLTATRLHILVWELIIRNTSRNYANISKNNSSGYVSLVSQVWEIHRWTWNNVYDGNKCNKLRWGKYRIFSLSSRRPWQHCCTQGYPAESTRRVSLHISTRELTWGNILRAACVWRSTQTLPRRSLLSEYHTASRYTRTYGITIRNTSNDNIKLTKYNFTYVFRSNLVNFDHSYFDISKAKSHRSQQSSGYTENKSKVDTQN